MKKVNLKGKLSFKKETIAKLNDKQMDGIAGGQLPPYSNNPTPANPCVTHPYCVISAATCGDTADCNPN